MRTFIQTIGSVPGPLSNAQFYMNKLKTTILVIFFSGSKGVVDVHETMQRRTN